jgi:DNA-binding beta-propeller fold protein YncE
MVGVAGRLLTALTVVTIPSVPSAQTYYAYVAAESDDVVHLVAFSPSEGARVEKTIPVGFWPAEIEGPHGMNVSPDGEHWYVTLGHGVPVFGSLLKYRAGVDTLEGRVQLGLFPATVAVSSVGLALAVNANFHGEHVPSTVSVVEVGTMTELARIRTCTMPHGSRLSPDGTKHYSGCMMDDEVVEIDVVGLEVTRRLSVGRGMHASHPSGGEAQCSPTWAAPSPDGRFVYVPCNKRDEVLEVELERWKVTRRFASPKAPYNAEVTPDGSRLVVTQKGSAQVSVWNLASGKRAALLPTTRTVTHGVAVTPDGRYAFISAEGVGGEPGAVDVIDLGSLSKVASVDVGKQAGGIVFWKRREGR